MSSSPPTETPRWRSPSTWTLRARLVAATMALLAVALIIVGVTTEITLRKALYDRIDGQLTAAASRSQGRFGDRDTPPAGTPAQQCTTGRPVGFPPGHIIA